MKEILSAEAAVWNGRNNDIALLVGGMLCVPLFVVRAQITHIDPLLS